MALITLRGSDGQTLEGKIAGERGDDVAAVVESVLKVHRGAQVSVTGGTVGILNVGEIKDVESISSNAYDLSTSGAAQVAEAIACISEAVLHNSELDDATRADLLHQMKELSRQALLPAQERAPSGVLRAITSAASTSLQTVAALAQVWSTWGAPIGKFFGL